MNPKSTSKSTPQSILQQIAQIQKMEKGTVSILRQGPKGPYYNHQCYEDGKNVSRYVPGDQVKELQEGMEGYQRFQNLTDEYVDMIIKKTREERGSDSKKNAKSSSGSRPGN